MRINDPLTAIAELRAYAFSLEQALETDRASSKARRTEDRWLVNQSSSSNAQILPKKGQTAVQKKFLTENLSQMGHVSLHTQDLLATCSSLEHRYP
ncbi:MAG: hypothetical protein HC936_00260 [Leptolyngbyaceae cyanobacterium SU_3_3]|nr:hypothetical protein [Leptolyngbyaceae cyanobacterium SU_3_3]NJR51171.1 hypothetical protein [Leptolyngbyaceae cyanobacterium CSU_1_3]